MTIKKAPEDLKHLESCGFYAIFRSKKPGCELKHHQPNGRFTLVCWMFILCEPPELYSEMLLCSK